MALTEVVFEIPAPGVLGAFTREHTEAKAVLRFVALGDAPRAVITLAGPTDSTAPVVRALREELGDGEFEILSITPYSVVVKAAPQPERAPWFAPVARFVEVFGRDTLLEPALIHDGRMRLRGVAVQPMDTRRALAKLQELQRLGGWDGFRVVHVTELDPKALAHRGPPLLDGEQEELLRLALAMGYYGTPRRCNLEDIAARVGLSVSPVHKRLKEVEHVLIRGHLEPGAPAPQRKRRAARPLPGPPRAGLLREVTVRLVPRAFGPAAFTERHAGARVLYQPLLDAPGVASHLLVVLAGPEPARDFLALVGADPLALDSEVLSRDAEHVSLKVRRRALPDGPGPARADGAAGPAQPGLGRDPLQDLVGALGRDAYLKPAVCEKGAVLARVVVLRRLDEEELAATLQDLAAGAGWTSAELVGVRDAGGEGDLLALPRAERMTGRQEEVLRIAHALGYYRTPRGCTLEDVAATLGISANAVHKNLSAAEQRIIRSYVGGAG